MARIQDDQQDINFTAAYPNHLRDIAPIFEINPRKELEIIANKYKLQAELALATTKQVLEKSRSTENLQLPKFDGTSLSPKGRKQQKILGESGLINTLNDSISLNT